jgi:dTDP-D-glucose 4,6-dehydratase
MATVASLNSTCNCVTNKSILVTDAGGFIDANFALEWLTRGLSTVVTLDKLTYAGNLDNLESAAKDSRLCLHSGRHRRRRTGRRTQTVTFETGIRKTVRWYLDVKMGRALCEQLLSTEYSDPAWQSRHFC